MSKPIVIDPNAVMDFDKVSRLTQRMKDLLADFAEKEGGITPVEVAHAMIKVIFDTGIETGIMLMEGEYEVKPPDPPTTIN